VPIERYKDITIGDRTYQVGLVTALTGDWIARTLRLGLKNISEANYQKIQTYLLEQCSVYEEAPNGVRLPMKIFQGGRWMNPKLSLEFDLITVNKLCEAALAWNFDDFFLKKLAEEAEESKKADLQASSATTP
jgi:hypothetical protein